MVFKSTLLLSFALVQMALATTVTIVSPKAKDVWHAGQVVEFKWTGEATPAHKGNATQQKSASNKKNHKNDMLSIALATGPAQSLVIDRVIASNVNITKGSYKWKIPKNINTTKKYVIEIGPNASDIAFAGYVTILKAPHQTNSTSTSSKPTKTTVTVKPSHTVVTTSTPTNKHEPTSVCVAVPNKNGAGSTVKCHPQPQKSHSQKKKSSSTTAKTTEKKKHTSSTKSHHSTTRTPPAATPSV
ncbi:hypothetical protein [Absidia glauca]|uniref:Yeast cell wall synthesis Kre9/Knh1-like N-terminal domain-containing protein n=1 Tax=Absidia glauca TaxID=4829 RepID=A0A163K2E8_ABSGL|nr:hypothetical protein [Absidia glauca]